MDQQIAEQSSYGDQLPALLVLTTRLIQELNGFTTQGIFRLPGNNDNIKALEIQVNSGLFYNIFFDLFVEKQKSFFFKKKIFFTFYSQ